MERLRREGIEASDRHQERRHANARKYYATPEGKAKARERKRRLRERRRAEQHDTH